MRPLLWKEMRDLRPWIAGAAAAVLVVELLCFSKLFERGFLNWYIGILPLLAAGVSVALA